MNADFISLTPPANTKDFGVGLARVKAIMINYPTIESMPIVFTATILGSIAPHINDQTYTLNSSQLVINYDQFKVIPKDYDVGLILVDAFTYSGTDELI